MVAKKLYYTMGEVAEMFDVNASLIRHWESKFSCLRPHKNKKGNRLFSPEDIERLKQIYHLVKERGMTLEGANKVMRASAKKADLSRDTEMLERLQRIRAALVEVREELKLGVGEQIVSSEVEDSPVEVEQKTTVEPVAEPINEPKVEPVTEPAAEPATEPQAATEAEQDSEPKSEQPKKRVVRRKKKSDDDNKELFPFYEQSLF
ncbi:MAG: MerR family transcriptional regulator [Alistipes sp.]|nr:MerR family transcriptional regulator [Alistipes sp.]